MDLRPAIGSETAEPELSAEKGRTVTALETLMVNVMRPFTAILPLVCFWNGIIALKTISTYCQDPRTRWFLRK
jgi:hypothetical protein